MKVFIWIVIFSFVFSVPSTAQKITYSQPERDEQRRVEFEILGKVTNNYLIYKKVRSKNYIGVYDNEMKQVARVLHDYIPDERLINIDFFTYPDFSYLVYQYQKKNVVYCDAVKIDGNGKKASEIINLRSTHISWSTNNKIYSAISSEDKSKIMVFKINSKNKSRYVITTLLLNDSLQLQKRSWFAIAMKDRDDYLDQFTLDNEGDLAFARVERKRNEMIDHTELMWKPATSDSLLVIKIPHKDIFLDDLSLKADNVNKRFFLTSFYYKERQNIDGFYFYVWDKVTRAPAMENSISFNEELRRDAKSNSYSVKVAFNDYFIKNITVKRDGGFVISSEAYYTSSRFNSWNRYNYLYGPYSTADYITYSNIYSSWWWRNRFNANQAVRHHSDNITVLSFDNTGKLEWSNVIHKEQFNDETDDNISYQVVNTGGQLHFLFNENVKRNLLLTDYTLTPDGKLTRNPTLKNLDKGYEFLPKYGKQVSSRQIIIPCFYNNSLCFAKIDFN